MLKFRVRRSEKWVIGIDIYTLPYIKQITSKKLLYSMGNYSVVYNSLYGKRIEKEEWIYAYV